MPQQQFFLSPTPPNQHVSRKTFGQAVQVRLLHSLVSKSFRKSTSELSEKIAESCVLPHPPPKQQLTGVEFWAVAGQKNEAHLQREEANIEREREGERDIERDIDIYIYIYIYRERERERQSYPRCILK